MRLRQKSNSGYHCYLCATVVIFQESTITINDALVLKRTLPVVHILLGNRSERQ